MIKQIDANNYKEAWREAERKSSISRFQTLGWGLEKDIVPADEKFRKSDFIKALKKVVRPIEKPKSSPKPSET